MKIYTKTGDRGETGLYGGAKCLKSDLRIETIGTVDELNSQLGVASAHLVGSALASKLTHIQSWLFDLGAELASLKPTDQKTDTISDREVELLEQWIDEMQVEVPPLKCFVLPGGSVAASHIHLGRSICRRAERLLVGLIQREEGEPREELLRFLNRLSDWLFVAARWQNQLDGQKDIPWVARTKASSS